MRMAWTWQAHGDHATRRLYEWSAAAHGFANINTVDFDRSGVGFLRDRMPLAGGVLGAGRAQGNGHQDHDRDADRKDDGNRDPREGHQDREVSSEVLIWASGAQ